MSAERVEALTEALFHTMYEPDDFARGLKEALAEAWDKGFTRGFYDVLAGADRDASESAAPNPYREEQS